MYFAAALAGVGAFAVVAEAAVIAAVVVGRAVADEFCIAGLETAAVEER